MGVSVAGALLFLLTACGSIQAVERQAAEPVTASVSSAPLKSMEQSANPVSSPLCHTDAKELDLAGEEQRTPALYYAAARAMQKCLEQDAPPTHQLDTAKRMQTHALIVINYLRAGDIKAAREQLDLFAQKYPQRDLYFQDQTSFLDTFRLILGVAPHEAAQPYSLLNANTQVKTELRRQQYWGYRHD